jgi:hypothetical protein
MGPSAGGPDRAQLRIFGLSLGAVCLVWAAVLSWRGEPRAAVWLAGAAPLLALVALLAPAALRPIRAVWMPVAHTIARAVTWLMLTTVFVLVFTPYAMILRALGKDPLERKLDRGRSSYWIAREEPRGDPARLEKQY